jgi:competence protein ComEC
VLAGRLRHLGRTSLAGYTRHWLATCVRTEVEQRRLFPWLAVAFGAGIAAAFAAHGPLSRWPPCAGAALFGTLAFVLRHRLAALAAMLALAALFGGFLAAVLRMQAVEAPVLDRMTIGKVEGFVESVEERQAGGRLVILAPRIERLPPASWPGRVRVSAKSLRYGTSPADVAPGDYVTGTLRLLPPPEAARPGGYDFARDAYFKGIGAVGSVSGRLARIEPPPSPPGFSLRLAAAVDRARNVLTAEIARTIGGSAGAVSAALITGKRGLIDEHTNDILRAAGIYHIVSISGLHMVLAAGVFFWLTRALLALSPHLAQTWPIKKLAALAGMAGATGYCIFSGSDVATERSLIMILVMQGAILFDRPALSLRNLALSALIVLAREPETLLGPSLQMSYAAVAGLIALAEWLRRRERPPREESRLGRAATWIAAAVLGTVATTIVATIATGPFSTFHFQNLQPYGVIGNAVTLPLVSFVVMPAAVIGVVAFPFGFDRPIWIVMGWAVQAVLSLSEWVAGMAGSVVIVPAFGTGVLTLFVAALLCTTLFVSGLRWLALAPAAFGLWAAATTPRADIYVARDGTGAAFRGPDGRLVVVGRAGAFTAEQWLRADGDARKAADAAAPGAGLGTNDAARCDRIGCVVPMGEGRTAAFVQDRRGFAEDCRRATIVVSRVTAPPGCKAALVIDRAVLAERGAVAIRFAPSGPVVDATRREHETRPWLARGAPKPPLLAERPRPSSDPSRQPRDGTGGRDSPDEPSDEAPDASPDLQ